MQEVPSVMKNVPAEDVPSVSRNLKNVKREFIISDNSLKDSERRADEEEMKTFHKIELKKKNEFWNKVLMVATVLLMVFFAVIWGVWIKQASDSNDQFVVVLLNQVLPFPLIFCVFFLLLIGGGGGSFLCRS